MSKNKLYRVREHRYVKELLSIGYERSRGTSEASDQGMGDEHNTRKPTKLLRSYGSLKLRLAERA